MPGGERPAGKQQLADRDVVNTKARITRKTTKERANEKATDQLKSTRTRKGMFLSHQAQSRAAPKSYFNSTRDRTEGLIRRHESLHKSTEHYVRSWK